MEYKQYITDIRAIVGLLRCGEVEKAVSFLPKIVLGIELITKLGTSEEIKRAAFAMRGIINAFQQQDYVIVADLLEYEILPFFENKNVEAISE